MADYEEDCLEISPVVLPSFLPPVLFMFLKYNVVYRLDVGFSKNDDARGRLRKSNAISNQLEPLFDVTTPFSSSLTKIYHLIRSSFLLNAIDLYEVLIVDSYYSLKKWWSALLNKNLFREIPWGRLPSVGDFENWKQVGLSLRDCAWTNQKCPNKGLIVRGSANFSSILLFLACNATIVKARNVNNYR